MLKAMVKHVPGSVVDKAKNMSGGIRAMVKYVPGYVLATAKHLFGDIARFNKCAVIL